VFFETFLLCAVLGFCNWELRREKRLSAIRRDNTHKILVLCYNIYFITRWTNSVAIANSQQMYLLLSKTTPRMSNFVTNNRGIQLYYLIKLKTRFSEKLKLKTYFFLCSGNWIWMPKFSLLVFLKSSLVQQPSTFPNIPYLPYLSRVSESQRALPLRSRDNCHFDIWCRHGYVASNKSRT
jgi:hypothetical protein